MTTTSTIAVQHHDGSITQIYCHFDGYIQYNGKILVNYYQTLELVEDLVSGGNLSSLGKRIHPVGEHSFTYPEKGTCVYYSRDDSEDIIYYKFNDYDHYAVAHRDEEYNYIFVDGEWYLQLLNDKILLRSIILGMGH